MNKFLTVLAIGLVVGACGLSPVPALASEVVLTNPVGKHHVRKAGRTAKHYKLAAPRKIDTHKLKAKQHGKKKVKPHTKGK